MPETNFFWDPLSDNVLQERDESGAVTAEYTTEPGLYGNLISQNRSGVENQYHFDALGSTLALTDDNQQVTDTYAYSAFGEATEQTGSAANPFKYLGRKEYYRDDVAGEHIVRRRPLSVRQGRWLSADPVGFAADVNTYRYGVNSPLVFADPSGLACFVFVRCYWTGYLFTRHCGLLLRGGRDLDHLDEGHTIDVPGYLDEPGFPSVWVEDHILGRDRERGIFSGLR